MAELLDVRTPDQDIRLQYRAPSGDAACRFRVWEECGPLGMNVIIVTELKDNPGMSITNAAEYVVREGLRALPAIRTPFVYIENYEFPYLADEPATYDVVSFEWNHWDQRWQDPRWRRVEPRVIETLIKGE